MEYIFFIKVIFIIALGVFIGNTLSELSKETTPSLGAILVAVMAFYLFCSLLYAAL